MSIASQNGHNSNEDTTMNSETVSPPAEQVAIDQTNGEEDTEVFIKDNIHIQTDYLNDDNADAVDSDLERLPTEEEWNGMKRYGSFITHDDAGKEYTFHVNDTISVLPTNKNPENPIADNELWIAQIKSIRARNTRDVWIRAKWFFHPKELPTKLKSKYKHTFAKMERISSNQADFIPTSTCCGHAKIIHFDEQHPEQENINGSTFFYRYDYDWTKGKNGELKKSSPPCSICKRAYNPNIDFFHLCPRPSCRQGWHDHCLERNNWYIKTPEHFQQRMESLDGEYNDNLQSDKRSPRKKAKLNQASQNADLYKKIPKGLLEIARQPIIRGRSMGVIGNVCSVTRARNLISAAMRDGEEIAEDWESSLGLIYGADAVGAANIIKAKNALAYACPSCGEPI